MKRFQRNLRSSLQKKLSDNHLFNVFRINELTDEDLYRRFITISGITVIWVSVIMISVLFFSTQIGGILAYISKNRNDTFDSAKSIVTEPRFSVGKEATNQELFDVRGYAQSGTTITLTLNGRIIGTQVTDGEGVFVFEKVQLDKGDNKFFAIATNDKGQESAQSREVSLKLDTTSPKISLKEPLDQTTVKNLNSRIMVKGEVNEQADITINGKKAIQKPDKSFEELIGANEGWVEIKIEVVDLAGNKASETIKVKYEKKSS